jgi:uncharacterized membrane protein
MGDAAAVILGLIVLGAFLTVVIGGTISRRNGKRASRMPTPLLGVHKEAMAVEKASQYYRLSQNAVRVMERMTNDPTVYLSDNDRAAMKTVIEQFYAI